MSARVSLQARVEQYLAERRRVGFELSTMGHGLASALPSASFRFAVTRDTLAVRLTVPLAGSVEDFHLQVSAPCRAHP